MTTGLSLGILHMNERAVTHERRYFATGSALRDFIWSKNFWKSNDGFSSPPLEEPEAGGVVVPCSSSAPDVAGRSSFRCSVECLDCCWVANVEIEFGDRRLGSAFASTERDRTLDGRENDLARETREGKVNEDEVSADDFGEGGDAGR